MTSAYTHFLLWVTNVRSSFRRFRFAHGYGVNTLYKFKGYFGEQRRHVLQILQSNEIYFSSLLELNDPFDMRPAVRSAWDLTRPRGRRNYIRACERMMRDIVPPLPESKITAELAALQSQDLVAHALDAARNIRASLVEFPIFCLSGSRQQVVSWAHYADQHRGVCIHFDSRRGAQSPFCFSRRVIYSRRRPVFEIPFLPKDTFSVANGVGLTKYSGWSYEDEFRLLSIPGSLHGFQNRRGRFASFDGRFIVGITLGANMSEECQHELIAIARAHEPPIPVWRTHIDARHFHLTFERVGSAADPASHGGVTGEDSTGD
jgi:hypothetical protein